MAFGDFTMPLSLSVLIALFFSIGYLFQKTLPSDLWKLPIPRNANAKGVNYDECWWYTKSGLATRKTMKLSLLAIISYRFLNGDMFLVGIAFHTDILLALVVVNWFMSISWSHNTRLLNVIIKSRGASSIKEITREKALGIQVLFGVIWAQQQGISLRWVSTTTFQYLALWTTAI